MLARVSGQESGRAGGQESTGTQPREAKVARLVPHVTTGWHQASAGTPGPDKPPAAAPTRAGRTPRGNAKPRSQWQRSLAGGGRSDQVHLLCLTQPRPSMVSLSLWVLPKVGRWDPCLTPQVDGL